jgi:hypothetical protein
VTDDHLSLDELAELDEGLLTPERASAARVHLHDCAQCQEQAASITATRTALGQLPTVTMPDDVLARLEHALAEAAPVPGSDEAPTSPSAEEPSTGSVTVIPHVTEIRSRRWVHGRPTLATSAAAAAVILVAVAVVVGLMHSSGSSSQDAAPASSAAGSGAEPGNPVGPNTSSTFTTSSTGQTYTAGTLATLVPGLVAPVPSGASAAAGGVGTPASAPPAAPSSGAKHTDSKAASNGAGTSDAGPESTTLAPNTVLPPTSSLSRQPSNQPVPKALRKIADSRSLLLSCSAAFAATPGAVPETIDFARWNGGKYHRAPSIFLVFNGPRPSTVAVYVVGPTCDPASLRTYQVVTLPS